MIYQVRYVLSLGKKWWFKLFEVSNHINATLKFGKSDEILASLKTCESAVVQNGSMSSFKDCFSLIQSIEIEVKNTFHKLLNNIDHIFLIHNRTVVDISYFSDQGKLLNLFELSSCTTKKKPFGGNYLKSALIA